MKFHLYFLLFVLSSSGQLIGDPFPPPPPVNPPAPPAVPAKKRPEYTDKMFAAFLDEKNRAKIGIRVIDESGKPLAGIACHAEFEGYTLRRMKWNPKDFILDSNGDGVVTWPVQERIKVRGKTNAEGIAFFEGRGVDSHSSIHAESDGCYKSWKPLYLTGDSNGPEDRKLEPYGAVHNLMLKKIINPVRMYVIMNWRRDMPGIGSYGFDMEKNDWVAPHGKGVAADMMCTLEKTGSPEEGKAKLTVSFPTQGDGIIPIPELKGGESELRLPREAPAEGYQSKITIPCTWAGGNVPKQTTNAMPGYFIRVRTVLDADGRVVNAWYGKIDDEFRYDLNQNPSAALVLSYHLNPDGTRNLEFDRKKNLLRVGSQGSPAFITP